MHVTVNLTDMDLITQAVSKLIVRERATSLFAQDDYLAARLREAARRLDRAVPRDVSIMAPGDTLDYREPYVPQLTTMKVDTARMGRLAGSLMLEQLGRDHREATVVKIKQTLVDRGSIAPPLSAP